MSKEHGHAVYRKRNTTDINIRKQCKTSLTIRKIQIKTNTITIELIKINL